MASIKKYTFYALAEQGSVIKSLTEFYMMNINHDGNFLLSDEGIFINVEDINKSKLVIVNLPRKNFAKYKCTGKFQIIINLKTLLTHIKPIKKKDAMHLFIDPEKENKLGIKIVPNNSSGVQGKVSISWITYYVTRTETTEIPETGYKFPVIIKSVEFQKTCKKFASLGKIINIKMQGSNFISFYVDGGEKLSTSEDQFGEWDDEEDDVYNKDFEMNHLSQLVKMCSLTPNIKVSYNDNQRYPLRFEGDSGALGEIKVFLKDKVQIDLDKERRKKRR